MCTTTHTTSTWGCNVAGEWIENKGRKRSPFKAGTKVDVKLRRKSWPDGSQTFTGRICGPGDINDWAIDNVDGDILYYRLHEEENNG